MKRRTFLLTAAGATGAAVIPTTGCAVSEREMNAELMMLSGLLPVLFIGLHLDSGNALALLNLATRAITPAGILQRYNMLAMVMIPVLIRQILLDDPKDASSKSRQTTSTGEPRLYVTLRDNSLAVINPVTMTIMTQIPLGEIPSQIAVSELTDFLAITNAGSSTVSIVSTATNSVTRTIALDPNSSPFGVAVLPDGRIYVVSESLNRIYVLDSSSNAILGQIELSQGASKIGLTPDGSTAWAPTASGSIHVIDTLTNTISRTVTALPRPVAVAFNPTGTRAFVTNAPPNQPGNLVVFDTSTFEEVNRFTVGTNPYSITVSPTGTELYIANFDSNSVTTIDLLANQVKDTLQTGAGPIELALLS